MPTGTRKCKVCGREYPYCKTSNSNNIFRFQDVACSPECGSIYFDRIQKSRTSKNPNNTNENKATKENFDKFNDLDECDDELEELDDIDDEAEETATV